MPDVVKQAFDAIKDSQLFLDEADFREQLSKSPKDVYGVLETTGLFLDYEDFSTSMALKKKDQTEFPEDVVEYYRGSGKESSGSPLQEQETPTPSELPKENGSSGDEIKAFINTLKVDLDGRIAQSKKTYKEVLQKDAVLRKEKEKLLGGSLYVPSAAMNIPSKEVDQARIEYQSLLSAQRLLEKSEKWISSSATDSNKKRKWVGRFVDGFVDTDWTDILTLGMRKMVDDFHLVDAANRANEQGFENISEEEQNLLVAYGLMQQARSGDKSMAYEGGRMLAEAIPFLVQFAMTGGVANTTQAAVTTAMTKLGEKTIIKALGYAGVKKVTGLVVGGTVRSLITTTGPSAIAERMAGAVEIGVDDKGKLKVTNIAQEGVGESIIKGLGSNAAEYVFESSGGMIGGAAKWINKTRAGKWLSLIIPDNKVISKLNTAIGWHGVVGEFEEEIWTSLAQSAITGDFKMSETFDTKNLLQMLIGVSAMGGVLKTMNLGINSASKIKEGMSSKVKTMSPDLMMEIDKAFKQENPADALDEILKDRITSKKDLEQAIDYIAAKAYDVGMQDSGGLGMNEDVVKEGSPQSKAVAKEVVESHDSEAKDIVEKESKDKQDFNNLVEMEESDASVSLEVEREVDERFDKQGRLEEIMSSRDVTDEEFLEGIALLVEKRAVRKEVLDAKLKESSQSDLDKAVAPEATEQGVGSAQGEKVAQEGDKTLSQGTEVSVPVEPSIKVQQFEIISKSNPMLDDVHTGIRRVDDIKTAEEAFSESIKNDEDATPDFTKADMQQALETGKITVYSSKQIDAGAFVSPSKMQAEAYSGDGKVYSKEVNVNDVAWIDQFEGQYAKTSGSNTKLIDGKEKLLEQPKIETDAIQVEEAEGVPTRQEATVSEEVGQEVRGKDKTLLSKAEEEGVIALFNVPDKLTEARKTLSKFVNSQWAKLNLPKQKEKHFVNKSLKVDDVEQAIKLIEEVRQLSEMEGLKNKDTKEALAEWKKVNRVAINALPQRVRLVFERKSERLTTQNRDKTFTSLNDLLTNEEYVKNVDSVARKIQEWKKRKFKGEVKDYTEGLSEIQVKAKHLFGKGDVRDFLNGVDITNDYFTPQLFAEMDMAMDALLSDKPSFSPIKSFMEDYRAMVDAIAVRKVTDVSLDEKTADKLKVRFEKLSERLASIEEQMGRGAVDVDALMSIQREMKGLERVLDRFEHRLSHQDSETIATLMGEMEDFFMGGYGGLSQKAKDIYEGAMEMAVLQEVKKIQPRELRNNTEQEVWARVVRTARLVDFNGRTEQEKQSAKNRRVMVNPSTVEMLNHCVNEVEVSGIMPSSFYPAVSDFLSSVQAGDFLTFVENIRKGDMVEDGMFRLSKMTESTVKKVIRKGSYLSGEYTTWHDSRFDMETGTDVPLERIFYTNMENAIIRAQTRATDDTQRYQKARRGAIGMSDKPMITTKSNYRQDVIENRIGIVMHNLHYYTMAEVKPKQVGDKFVLVDRGGERKEFGSYDEAYRIGNERKEKYLELDSFGRKIRNGEDIDAKLSSNIFETALFVKAQKEAYKSFGKEELIVRNMDDVKLLLKPKEVLVVKEIRKLLDGDVRDKVRATAYYEGKDVDLFGENYIPTDVRVSTDPKVVSEGIKKLVGNANKGLPIKATGHILPKMPVSEGWVDTNIDRIIKRYISDVYLSYEVLPILKQEVKAMDAVGKRMKAMGEVPTDGFFSYREMEKFVKNFKWDRLNRYDINMKVGRRIPSKIGRTVGNVFVDISEGVDRTYDVARTLVLADVMRPYLDASSQLVKQFAELGLPAWDYGRFKEMVGVFEYLPEGSTMQTWMREGLTRYGDPGFIWGNSPFIKEMNDKFMGLADRFTKPLAWVAKFDEVYEALAGERFNAKRFIQDTEYRNEMINHPYFNQADVVAGNYTNRIHFARTQGALASMLFNRIKPGTSAYAWMMPVMAYTSQQFKSMLISNEKMFKGSKVGRDAEARRMTGSVISGMWYGMNRVTLNALMDIVAAIVVGRWDRVKELWDEIKGVWSWEGLAANFISSISNIYLSGYTAVGTNLANLGIACFEVMEKRSADDPVMLRKIQDARKELKKVVGVGYYNVGDLEGGKVGIKQVVNVIAPVIGSFVYDAMDSGIKASEIFARKLDDFRSITKDEEKGMWYNVLRVSYSLAFMVLGAPPTAKDLRRIVGENIRLSARLPFDKDIDNYMKEVDYIRQIGQYYDDVTTNAEFTDTQEGAVSVKVKVNGKWEEARTVGKGEDEILQVKEGLRWRDVTPEEELSKEFSALIKATELMQTKVDYDPRMFDKDERFKAKADAEGILANFAEDDMSDEDLSFARDEMQVFLGDNWDVTGLPLIDLKKANAEVNGISSFQDAKRLIRDIDGRARKVRGKKEGDDKEFDTISRTYEHLNSWYKKNENDWAILTKLYNDIQIDRMLTNRQKFVLYKMIKPEMQELMECIIRGDYYIGTFGRVEKSWREMERKMDKMEYDMEKKQMDVQIDMVLD